MHVTEHKIIEMAHWLFIRQGIRATRLQDIARAANTTVTVIYASFANKTSLVSAVVEQVLTANKQYLQVNPRLSPNATTELNNFFAFLEKQVVGLTPVIMLELRKYYPDALQKIVIFRNTTIIPALRKNIERGLAEDNYRPDFDHTFYGCMYFILLKEVIERHTSERVDLKKVIHDLNGLFLHGILTAKGMRLVETSLN